MSLTDNQAALIALVIVAMCATWSRPEAKDALMVIAGGIVGWMSRPEGNKG